MTEAELILARTGGRELERIVYTPEEIAVRVHEMGEEITRYFPPDEELLVLGLLKGSFIFMSDLVREIARPVQVDFLVASSYGSGTTSSGEVKLLYDPDAEFEGRHVIIVEDIVDSGTTINRLVPLLRERRPRSLEMCALLHKHLAPQPGPGAPLGRLRRPPRVPHRLRPGPLREFPEPPFHREPEAHLSRRARLPRVRRRCSREGRKPWPTANRTPPRDPAGAAIPGWRPSGSSSSCSPSSSST